MKDEQRLKALEDEFKVLKNEIKSVLLDLREQCLNLQNPFNFSDVKDIKNQPDNGDTEQVQSEIMPLHKVENSNPVNADCDTVKPKPQSNQVPDNATQGQALNKNTNLVVIAGLTQWVDQTTAKLGRERAEALVEIASTMDRLPSHLKDALIKMIRLSHHLSDGQNISTADYLSAIAKLENLLGGLQVNDNVLLSVLSMMTEHNNG